MPDTLGYLSEAFYEHKQIMRDGLGTAIELIITAGLDHLIMGIALETFWGGVAQAEKFQDDLAQRAGRRRYHRFDSYGGCPEEVWSRQYSPQQPRGDEIVHAYFVEAGFAAVRLKRLKRPTPRAIAQVTQQDIRNGLRELDGEDVEAMLTLGTALSAAMGRSRCRALARQAGAVSKHGVLLARHSQMRDRRPHLRSRTNSRRI